MKSTKRASRCSVARSVIASLRTGFGGCLAAAGLAAAFSATFACGFDLAFRLAFQLPLFQHFGRLPGDQSLKQDQEKDA